MQLTTTANGLDYTKYLWGQTVKKAQVNVPTTLTFALAPVDSSFIKLVRGNYVILNTTTYPYWFTGYIVNDPSLEYLGTNNNVPVWGYHYVATDDSYILNLNPLGVMPPFVNTTQGAILTALVERIQPGVFDTSAIQGGEPIARYVVNPNDRFSDVVKAFGDAAYYQFAANNGKLSFAPTETLTAGVVIDGNDKNFSPKRLKLSPTLNSKIYNDVIVVGDLEPQNKVIEYYVGDGYTGKLPLLAAPFGIDRNVLLVDNFNNSSFDTAYWTVYDSANQNIQLYNGYLNTLGGTNDNTYSEYLTSANLVPLEGHLRFTHGEYDFVLPSSGVICGIWTGAPALTGQVTSPSTAPTLSTSASGTTVTDYVVITLVDANGNETAASPEASIQSAATHQVTVTSPGATTNAVSYNVYAGTTSGAETLQATVAIGTNYTQPTSGWTTTGVRAPVANLTGEYTGCLFGILCSKNGQQTQLNPIYNGVANASEQVLTQYNYRYVFRTLQNLTNPFRFFGSHAYMDEAGAISRLMQSGVADTAVYQTYLTELNFAPPMPVLSYTAGGTLPQTTYYVRQSYMTAAGETAASNETYLTVPANNLLVVTPPPAQSSATGWNCYVGTQYGGETLQNNGTIAMGTSFTEGTGGLQNGAIPPASAIGAVETEVIWQGSVSIPSTVQYVYYTPVALNDLHVTVYGITIDQPMQVDLKIEPKGATAYYSKLVGPNELDSLDGMAPWATVTDQQSRKQTISTTLGSKQYNPGQASLEFFKDSTNQSTQVPQVGDLVYVGYHAAGPAIARVQDRASITSEAAAWGDNGLRSTTQTRFSPLPNSSAEAEYAGAAFIQDNAYQKYDGSYTCYNLYSVTAEPLPGTILKFQNLPSQFPSVQAELISEVQTTLLHNTDLEVFQFDITFGAPDLTRKLLAQFQVPSDVFYPYDDAAVYTWVDYSAVGTTSLSNVEGITLDSYDANNLYYNTNQAAPSPGGFEVRYSDDSWGADNGSNLVGRFSNETLAVPRTVRGRVVWVRQYDERNQLLWSEDLTQSAWSLYGSTAPTVTNSAAVGPDNNSATISTVKFGAVVGSTISQSVVNRTACGTGATAAYNVWVKGTKGQSIQYFVGGSTTTDSSAYTTLTFTGKWQYISGGRTFTANDTGVVSLYFATVDATAPAVMITRAMVELGTATPTIYCKTNSIVYGATSKFSTALHCAFPFVPPEPTATINTADPLHPIITAILPGTETDNSAAGIAGLNNAGPSLADIWGYEIRASDNSTVLEHNDLVNTSNTLAYTYDNSSNSSRSLTFYVYFYNLLGEYSTGYQLTWSVAAPSVTAVSVDETTQKVVWTTTSTGLGTYTTQVEVDATDNTFTHDVVNTKVSLGLSLAIGTPGVSEYPLSQKDFFEQRWIRVTPFDVMGAGTAVVLSHVYTPTAVIEFDANEVYSVQPS